MGIVIDHRGFSGARLGSIEEIVRWAEPLDVVGIDIPIGHIVGGPRRADVEARRFVGPRGSSVIPLAWSKKSWNGLLLRRRLLIGAGIELPDVIADVAGAAADDVVDAAVVAWSAWMPCSLARTWSTKPSL